MGLYDMSLKWHLVIYFQLNIQTPTLTQGFHGRPFPTKMVSQFLHNARKGGGWGKLMMNTRAHHSAKSQEKNV